MPDDSERAAAGTLPNDPEGDTEDMPAPGRRADVEAGGPEKRGERMTHGVS